MQPQNTQAQNILIETVMIGKIPQMCRIFQGNLKIPKAFTGTGRRIRDTTIITQKRISIFKR